MNSSKCRSSTSVGIIWLLCLEAVFVKGMACKPEDAVCEAVFVKGMACKPEDAVCEAVFVKGMACKPGDAVYEAAGRGTF